MLTALLEFWPDFATLANLPRTNDESSPNPFRDHLLLFPHLDKASRERSEKRKSKILELIEVQIIGQAIK